MRRALVAAAVALALVIALATTPTSPAHAATTPFVVGEADAVSQVISVLPAISGYSLGVETGVSIADFHGTDGQGQAQILTSALIGALSLPLPASLNGLIAESSSTKTSKTSTLEGANGEGAGVLGVTAGQSGGTANASLTSFSLSSVISVNGGQSSASTGIVNGDTRQAQATSSIASISLLGGLISLNGLQWTAHESTGAQSSQSGTFSIGSISIGGSLITIPANGLTTIVASVNKLLAPTGLHIALPTEQIGKDGSVQETALAIGLDNSALGKEVVSPFVGSLQPLRTVLNQTLVKLDPTLGESDLILEIGLSILAGQGTLDLSLGGAYAESDGTSYSNPLSGGSGTDSSAPPSPNGATTSGTDDLSQGLGSPPSGLTTPSTQTGTATPSSPKPSKLSLLSTSSSCESTSVGSCHTPHSVVILISLLALTLALLGFESLRMHRRKRLLIPEDT
jgi:hypothetical protein